ncbi:MAG: DUF420 domain-containing protein, partial [Chitinophagaceae bacterium]
MEHDLKQENKHNKAIIAVSILIPVAVAILFNVKLRTFGIDVKPLSFLPPIYAAINGITAVVLVISVMAIRRGNQKLHERLMKFAIGLSVSFLVMYVAYHMTAQNAFYGDADLNGELSVAEISAAGWKRIAYLLLLSSHILLSIIIIPLVLITYVRALAGNFARHRKISVITYPIWLYVAITGVVVY